MGSRVSGVQKHNNLLINTNGLVEFTLIEFIYFEKLFSRLNRIEPLSLFIREVNNEF